MKTLKRVWFTVLAIPLCLLMMPVYALFKMVHGAWTGELDDHPWYRIF